MMFLEVTKSSALLCRVLSCKRVDVLGYLFTSDGLNLGMTSL